MQFVSILEPYNKGQLLTAARLNLDFEQQLFLLKQQAQRYSDGILSGLKVWRKGKNDLFLEKGTFSINGQFGWLRDNMKLALPPMDKYCRLVLMQGDSDNSWQLLWGPDKMPETGISLCRVHLKDIRVLTNSWTIEGEKPKDLTRWRMQLEGTGYIQLEYAMAASLAQKPTLLPVMQHQLARFAKNSELKLMLLNGLLPIMDYYEQQEWTEALQYLYRELKDEKVAIQQQPKRNRSW